MSMPFDSGETSEAVFSSTSGFKDQFWQDPVSSFAQMRTAGAVLPAHFLANGQRRTWLITHMEEVVQILKDYRRFTVHFADFTDEEARRNSQRFADNKAGQKIDEGFALLSGTMLGVDGLDHRRLRSLVSQVFTPKYTQGLRPTIQYIADRLLDCVAGQGIMELMEDFAYPLPINVICSILGIPDEHWKTFREGAMTLVEGETTTPDDEHAAERARKIGVFQNTIALLVAEKRRNPQDDLISQLSQAEEAGDRLSEPELLSMIGLLIVAGHETTANLIGNGILALLDHPDQLARLRADPSLIPAAVEELLRFTGPNLFTPLPRVVTEECDLGGWHLSPGDIVVPLLTSANHDENYFTDATKLDIMRHLDHHVAFGYGIHICLGAPLARLEADIAFTTLLRRMPGLHLNALRESITWYGVRDVRGLTCLPVAF